MAEERLTDEPVKLDDLDLPQPETLPVPEEKEPVVLSDREREEYERIVKSARRKMRAGDYAGAEKLYAQAAFSGEQEAEIGLWAARTHEYTDASCFSKRRTAVRFSKESAAVRATVLEPMGERFRAEREECAREAAPLEAQVEAGMSSRRGAFAANRNFWLVRFLIAFAVTAAFGIACAVSANFIVRTRGIAAPVLTAVFGGIAAVALVVTLFFLRKLFVAQELVAENERLSSTETGAKLEALQKRIEILDLILEGAEGAEEESEEDAETEIEAPMSEDEPSD